MDRLISEEKVLEAFREYQGSISDFYKAVKAIPSADKTCEGCIFTRGCCSCQQCSRFYTDMYTVREVNNG